MREYVVFRSSWRMVHAMGDATIWFLETERHEFERGLSFFEGALRVAWLRQQYPTSPTGPPDWSCAHASMREALCWTRTRH